MTDPMKCFPDPDSIGQSEYRVMYEHLRETLDDCPEKERFELASSMLDEFESHARSMRADLYCYPKEH